MHLISLDDFRKRRGPCDAAVFRLATGAAAEVAGRDRTLRFCFSDGSVDRAGDRIDPNGWDLAPFKQNNVALWAHDSFNPPIGRAHNVGTIGDRLMGDIEFAPAETYAFADTIYRLAKDGFINAVSVGFKPTDWEFSNDKERPYGIDFRKQELLEISPCPVPCNANALIEARAKGIDTRPLMEWAERLLDGDGGQVLISRHTLEDIFKAANTPHSARARYRALTETKHMAEWKCGASRDLAVEDSDAWDGPAAEKSIFEWAGGEDFDPAKARKGFLFYDAAKPKERGSYKDPIAHVVGGELKVPTGAIRAAASRVPQTDIPDSVKSDGEAVLAHYKEKAGIKSAGEGTNVGGGALVGNCGRKKDEECGMKDPAECAMHAPENKRAKGFSGSCGRGKDEECGMKDPQECSVHATFGDCGRDKDEMCGMKDPQQCRIHREETKSRKSGRRVSRENLEHLDKALDHIGACLEHIKAVKESNDPDDDGDDDAENDGPEFLDPPPKTVDGRLAEVRRLRSTLKS